MSALFDEFSDECYSLLFKTSPYKRVGSTNVVEFIDCWYSKIYDNKSQTLLPS